MVDDALRAIDARSPVPRVRDIVHLPGYGGELLIAGNRALAISSGDSGDTVLSELNIADPEHLRIVRTLSIDGQYVSARCTATRRGSSSPPTRARCGSPVVDLPRPIPIEADRGARRRGQAAARPPRRLGAVGDAAQPPHRPHAQARARRLRRRPAHAALHRRGDADGADDRPRRKGLPAVDADAVMTERRHRLRVARPASTSRPTAAGSAATRRSTASTSTAPTARVYRASGQVPGDLLNQFSMSEYKDVLRVATTDSSGAKSQSFVTALRPRSGRLAKIGQVGGLGGGRADLRGALHRAIAATSSRSARSIRSTRSTSPTRRTRACAASSRSPATPRTCTRSGAHRLLGVGQDATPQGRQAGTQLSLFDVADPAAPKLLSKVKLGHFTSSQAEYDHHAFLWWEPLRLAVIPVVRRGRHDARRSAFNVDRGKITPAGSSHENGFVLRTLIVAGRLLTLSDHALSVYDPATLRPGPVARF